MQTDDLAALLDPGPAVAAPAFRAQVLARIVMRAERRRAWRKHAAYWAAGAGFGLVGPLAAAAHLPSGLVAVLALALTLALAFSALPPLRRMARHRLG